MNIEDIKKYLKSIKPLTWILIAVGILVIMLILIYVFSNQPSADQIATMDSSDQPIEESAVVVEKETGEEVQENGSDELELAEIEEDSGILGEGCDWSTCAWMEAEQCVECGGKWQVYGDETFCDCIESKWNFQKLEWCKFEGGTWLQDEDRCTFAAESDASVEIEGPSACSNLYFFTQSGSEDEYFAFRQACKIAGGVDQCWDEACSLKICMCPEEKNVSISCDWVRSEAVDTDIRCYDDNGTCWLTIQPSDAIIAEGKEALLDAVVTTSDGQFFSSIDLNRGGSGCIFNSDQISCLVSEDGAFNASEVENIYLCMDICCINLVNMESGSVVVQSGDCPAGGNLEVHDFNLAKGRLTFQLRNNVDWDVNTLEIFLNDAKGDIWTSMDCTIDNKYNTIMNCDGWAVYKSGYATITFYYGSGSDACGVNNFKFTIPEMDPCNYNQEYCSLTGTCCAANYSCCTCGCVKLDDGEVCADVCN